MNVSAAGSTQPRKWTILLYSAADNDLKDFMLEDVNETESVGSDSYTNLVAQVDQGRGKGAARYLLQKDENMGEITSPVVEDLGPVNMSDPKNLADFVEWGMKTYPAENYMVILSDHGDGWKGALQDWTHDGWMSLPQIREGLAEAQQRTGRKIDVLGFDACLMASTEVAHELKDTADYLVASEETEAAEGWNYTKFLTPELLERMRGMHLMKVNVEPRDLAILAVRTAQAGQENLPTMSAIDLSKAQDVTNAVDRLGRAIASTSANPQVLSDLARDTQEFTGYRDAFDFANRLQFSVNHKDRELRSAAREVKKAVSEAVIAEQHSPDYPNAHGLTLEISPWGKPTGYDETLLAKETSWPQALEKIGASAREQSR